MKAVAILQARSTSSRLPGKALLPVAGYPSAVLAALRPRTRGLEVIAASSTDSSDDELVQAFQQHGVRTFRGPLEDVLARYDLAAAQLADGDVIVRLTADNVFPDGDFVRELIAAFLSSGTQYMTTGPADGRLPYGLSAEVFSVASLRQARKTATSDSDREHVTPWIIRNCACGSFIPQQLRDVDYSHLRCTIDDQDDYQLIGRVFSGVADPINVSWYDLTCRLAKLPRQPAFRIPYKVVAGRAHSELTLGTAQLGMEYGIVNRTGKPSSATAVNLVREAIAHGVTEIDTARAYGDSEAVLGEALRGAWRSRTEIITKLDPLDSVPPDAEAELVQAAVDRSVATSCQQLGTEYLPVLLLHRWHHRTDWDGIAWKRLLELQSKGTIGALGVSVYDPEQALEALRDSNIKHLQIPMNVLDWRWKANKVDHAIADRPDVIVHARSAFLQGILLHGGESWPQVDYDATDCVGKLQELTRRFNRDDMADLCLAYVRAQPWITSIVVGCETSAQLQHNLDLFRRTKLTAEQCAELECSLPKAPEALLNPSMWKVNYAQLAIR